MEAVRQSAQMWLGGGGGGRKIPCCTGESTLHQWQTQHSFKLHPCPYAGAKHHWNNPSLYWTLSSMFYPRPSPACFTPTPFVLCPNQCVQLAHLCWGMGVGLVLQQQLGNVDVVVVGGHVQRGQAVLALHVRVGILLQQQACHLDVAVLGGDVQRGEALLQWERRKGVCVCKNGPHQYLINTFC